MIILNLILLSLFGFAHGPGDFSQGKAGERRVCGTGYVEPRSYLVDADNPAMTESQNRDRLEASCRKTVRQAYDWCFTIGFHQGKDFPTCKIDSIVCSHDMRKNWYDEIGNFPSRDERKHVISDQCDEIRKYRTSDGVKIDGAQIQFGRGQGAGIGITLSGRKGHQWIEYREPQISCSCELTQTQGKDEKFPVRYPIETMTPELLSKMSKCVQGLDETFWGGCKKSESDRFRLQPNEPWRGFCDSIDCNGENVPVVAHSARNLRGKSGMCVLIDGQLNWYPMPLGDQGVPGTLDAKLTHLDGAKLKSCIGDGLRLHMEWMKGEGLNEFVFDAQSKAEEQSKITFRTVDEIQPENNSETLKMCERQMQQNMLWRYSPGLPNYKSAASFGRYRDELEKTQADLEKILRSKMMALTSDRRQELINNCAGLPVLPLALGIERITQPEKAPPGPWSSTPAVGSGASSK